MTNLEKYKKDIEKLIEEGNKLYIAINFECYPKEFKNKTPEVIKSLPIFDDKYQTWYSEALVLIKQLLPDRIDDFKKLYEKPKTRKDITFENYVIEDALQGLSISNVFEKKILGKHSAIPRFQQQLSIIESCKKRFESSLFDIKQLLQADLFDSEMDAAEELNKKGFVRASGAICGVVIEGHLSQVCKKYNLRIKKKNPTINDFNDLLKSNDLIDISIFRNIQFLADLRNKCAHKRKKEPTKDEIKSLIKGVNKIIRTLF